MGIPRGMSVAGVIVFAAFTVLNPLGIDRAQPRHPHCSRRSGANRQLCLCASGLAPN